MYQTSCHPLPPRPKSGRSLSAALPTAPAILAHLHVVRRKWVAIAAGGRSRVERNARANAIGGVADQFSFGCFKARPRYQFVESISYKNKLERVPRLTIPSYVETAHSSDARLRAQLLRGLR
jgi:hypothetical protein